LSQEELELEQEAEAESEETPEPLDIAAGERKLVTQPYDYSVDQLVSHVEKGKILLIEVPYQREYVWDDSKASRLIESLLLNVPIPVCYFAENEDGSWEVIDGLQRVHSIARYLGEKFVLRGLSVLTELNGKRFGELPGRDQRRIESRTLRFVVITEESHPDIKFDVFERLNTGAVKLTAQELRNCIYRGAFNDGLHELAEDKSFRHAIGRPRDPRMRDEELVLRFFALHASLPNYRPPIAQLLNEYMRENRSQSPSAADLRLFKGTMKTIGDVFGGTGFRTLRDDKVTANLNRALFDAVAISFGFANRSQLLKKAGEVKEGHAKLLNDAEFIPLVGRATADRSRMLGRIRKYTNVLKACGVGTDLPDLPED
jgi:Protein of unknown function DUF262